MTIRMNKLLLPFALLLLALSTTSLAEPLVFGPGPEAPATSLDTIVAVVNNDIITRHELNVATAVITRQMRQNKVPVPPRAILEKQVLERLILTKLQMRTAERNGIVVDDATLNAAINALAQRNKLSLDQLRRTVEKDGIAFAKFRDQVRQELTATRLRQALIDSQIQISDQDIESMQAQMTGASGSGRAITGNRRAGVGGQNRRYHIAQILISVSEGASPDEIAVSKRQAEQVLSQLRSGADFRQLAARVSAGQQALEGGDLGWRRTDQLPSLFSKVVPTMQAGQVSQLIRSPSGFHIVKLLAVEGGNHATNPQQTAAAPKAATITQARVRHILLKTSQDRSDSETRQKLEQLRQRILDGEDFAALARAHSNDQGSAIRGGDLGWVSPSMLVPPFERAMQQLPLQKISLPVQTRFGWHLIQVLERRQVAGTSVTERARIREALFRRRADEEWDLILRRLREEAYVEIRLPKNLENTDSQIETAHP
ncbi:MAG: molecular chaperone SurA [Candidatus Contendobacter odensis]|uniref:Chaperone SurA n=1 Tax=Candidatus Contendibacter odensensis TaxID=1400860 RepID=A0A2G6PGN8_9GAMM|nr:MAG: molecular chaperone SurA [Candidatus Contendobacter odensis]